MSTFLLTISQAQLLWLFSWLIIVLLFQSFKSPYVYQFLAFGSGLWQMRYRGNGGHSWTGTFQYSQTSGKLMGTTPTFFQGKLEVTFTRFSTMFMRPKMSPKNLILRTTRLGGWSNNDGSRHFRVHESMKNGCNVLGANFSSGFLLTGKRFIHIFDG